MKKVTRLLYGEKPWKIIYIYIYMFGVRLNMIEQHLGSFTLFWGLLPGQQILESPGR